jgi:hypothetical protein
VINIQEAISSLGNDNGFIVRSVTFHTSHPVESGFNGMATAGRLLGGVPGFFGSSSFNTASVIAFLLIAERFKPASRALACNPYGIFTWMLSDIDIHD